MFMCLILCVRAYLEEADICWDSLPHRQTDGISRNQLSGQQVLHVPLPDTEIERDSKDEWPAGESRQLPRHPYIWLEIFLLMS